MLDHFTVELCKLVQRYPEIYDICHERFHSDEAKKNAWKTIASDLGLQQPSKCEIKWKSIKHQFVKARKENNTAWELWPFLGFLEAAAERSFHEPPASKTTPVLSTGSAKEPDVFLMHSHGPESACQLCTTPTETSALRPLMPFPAVSQSRESPRQAHATSLPQATQRPTMGHTPPGKRRLELGEAIQEQLAGSSKAEAPSPKHPKTRRSSFGADDKGPSGMNCASPLHLKFFEQVQEKFMRLKPEVVWAMKATILSMLDNAAKS